MRVPKYRKHSTRDCGFVEFQGKRHYFAGGFDSVESREAYRKFLRENVLVDAVAPVDLGPAPSLATVGYLYLQWARVHYPPGNRSEYGSVDRAVSEVVGQFGHIRAQDFGPLRLKEYRQQLIAKKLARGYINAQVNRIKRMYRWLVSEQHVPVSTYQALLTVGDLQKGRSAARETESRQPVPWPHVEAILDLLTAPVLGMVKLQWHTGARSESLCYATPAQFDRSSDVWLWRPVHKMEYRGQQLILPIGPRAAEILAPFLDRDADEYLFSPREVRKQRHYGTRYSPWTYRRAVVRAQTAYNKAVDENYKLTEGEKHARKITPWTPHQLRNSRGQLVREKYGVEAAQAILGHISLVATEVYTKSRLDLAIRVARESG